MTATCPDHVWALDFLVDQTADGRPLKILTVTDEHTREALATRAARRMGADETVRHARADRRTARPGAPADPL